MERKCVVASLRSLPLWLMMLGALAGSAVAQESSVKLYDKGGELLETNVADDATLLAELAGAMLVVTMKGAIPTFTDFGDLLESKLRSLNDRMRALWGVKRAKVLVKPDNSEQKVIVYWKEGFAFGNTKRAILIAQSGELRSSNLTSLYVLGYTEGATKGADVEGHLRTTVITSEVRAYGGNGRLGGGNAWATGVPARAKGGTGTRQEVPADGGNAEAWSASNVGDALARGGNSTTGGGQGGPAVAWGGSFAEAIGGDSLGESDPVPGGSAWARAGRDRPLVEQRALAHGGRGGGIQGALADIGKTLGQQAGKGGAARADAVHGHAFARGGQGGPAVGLGVYSGDGGDVKAIGQTTDVKGGEPGDAYFEAEKGDEGTVLLNKQIRA